MTPKVHYIYHWNRILGILTVLVLLTAVVSYAVFSMVETENLIKPQDMQVVAPDIEAAPEDHSLLQDEANPPVLADRQPLHQPELSSEESVEQKSNQPSSASVQFPPIDHKEDRAPADGVEGDSPPLDTEITVPPAPRDPLEKEVSEPETVQLSSPDIPQPGLQKAPDTEAPRQHDMQVAASDSEAAPEDYPLLQDEANPPVLADRQPLHQPELSSEERPEQSEPAEADTTQDAGRDNAFHLQEINRLSPSVKRFTLARSITKREPIGTIDSITMDEKGVAAVYAFSEVAGMRDRLIYYLWLNNGKKVAKVRVNVGNDSWRSYSSKVINENMKGNWTVELHTADGQILASAKFFAGR